MRNYIIFIMSMIAVGCNQTKIDSDQKLSAIDIQQKLKQIKQLAVVEYDINKIVKSVDNSNLVLRERKYLMEVPAKVKAGINLEDIGLNTILISGRNIKIIIPKSKILNIDIEQEKIKELERSTGLFNRDFTLIEKNTFLKIAESEINKDLKKLDILSIADQKTEKLLRTLFTTLGFRKIDIISN